MPQLKVGLTPRKTSYFDPLTNLYLTLAVPFETVNYTEAAELKNITVALLASQPSLVLYEGQLPEEAIQEWESKLAIFKTNSARIYRNLSGDLVSDKPNLAFDRSEEFKQAEIAGLSVKSIVIDEFATVDPTADPTKDESPVEDVLVEDVLAEAAPEAEATEKKATNTNVKGNKKAANKE